jgi:hypothetical protein
MRKKVCKDWRSSAPITIYEILGNLPGTILNPLFERIAPVGSESMFGFHDCMIDVPCVNWEKNLQQNQIKTRAIQAVLI